jgi:hypothetical protein
MLSFEVRIDKKQLGSERGDERADADTESVVVTVVEVEASVLAVLGPCLYAFVFV